MLRPTTLILSLLSVLIVAPSSYAEPCCPSCQEQGQALRCTLSSKELEERQATLMADLGKRALRVTELQDGFAIDFNRETVPQLQELMVLEEKCCGFLSLALDTEREGNEVRLTLQGPAGTKDFLRKTMQSLAGPQGL